MTNTITREQWLNQASEHLRTLFESVGESVPTKVRASCGFPSKSAMSAKNRRIGECWNSVASADSHTEIFISPTISDSSRVLDILAHEWIHAIHPNAGHGKAFKHTATAIGLEGKMTATVAGDKFKAWASPVLAILGDYPHAELKPANAIKSKAPECSNVSAQTAATSHTLRASGWLTWAHLTALSMGRCPQTDISAVSPSGLISAMSHYLKGLKMTMLTDPNQIEHYRMIVLWRGLGLELTGMKMSRGVSCYKTLKGMGMKGTKAQIHVELGKLLGKIPESV